MLSISENFILTDLAIPQDQMISEEPPMIGVSYFSTPAQALMGVLSTPQLQVSEEYNSPAYLDHLESSERGFAPEESIHTQKFRLSDD